MKTNVCKDVSGFTLNAFRNLSRSTNWYIPNFTSIFSLSSLLKAIKTSFGSYEAFVSQFETAAKTRFGSGWAWLLVDATGKLVVSATPNQDNPLMDIAEVKGTPILGLDVWEHAYYLHYQNRRPDYVTAFWKVVNWKAVADRFAAASK